MSNPIPVSELLATALDAVKAAREIILHYYQADVRVEMKPDQSPVTIADQKAEEEIISVIRAKYPSHAFFGEETGESSGLGETNEMYTWIIDPIDGTKNFIRQIPLFGTQLAVMHRGEIIAGVSSMPAIGELLYASKGGGAFLNGTPASVSKISEIEKSAISFYGYEKDPRFTQVMEFSKRVAYARGFGDCYSYHLVATGRIDAAFEPRIRIWDIAPFAIVIPEAGGKISDDAGRKIDLETRSIVASNGALHQAILQNVG